MIVVTLFEFLRFFCLFVFLFFCAFLSYCSFDLSTSYSCPSRVYRLPSKSISESKCKFVFKCKENIKSAFFSSMTFRLLCKFDDFLNKYLFFDLFLYLFRRLIFLYVIPSLALLGWYVTFLDWFNLTVFHLSLAQMDINVYFELIVTDITVGGVYLTAFFKLFDKVIGRYKSKMLEKGSVLDYGQCEFKCSEGCKER